MTRSRWAIAFGAVFLCYLLFGFLLLPFLVQRYGPSIASEQLQRPVALGKVRFNPLLLTLELEDFSLKEAKGEPMVSLGRLFADLELKSVFQRALAFREIRLEKPFVHAVIGSDARLNFARLADAFPPSKAPEPPAEESGLPRLLIDHFALVDGTVEFADQSRSPPVAERLEAINLEIDAISTLPDNQASHHISAAFGDGSVLDWHGHLSFEPLASEGELRLDGFKLSTPWPFLKDRIAVAKPEGQLAVAARYRFRKDQEQLDLVLSEIGATLAGLKLVPAGGKQPLVEMQKIRVSNASFGLIDQSVKVPEFTIEKGKVAAAIDAAGTIDWQRLMKPAAGQTAPPKTGSISSAQPPAASKPWRIDVASFKLADVALQLTDASRRMPVDATIGSFGLGLNLALEAGAGEPKVSVGSLTSEVRNLVLKPVAVKEPMLSLESVRVADGTIDLSSRTIKLPSIAILKGTVLADVDEDGAMNWARVGEPASIPSPGPSNAAKATQPRVPLPKEKSPPTAPWRVAVEQLKIEQIGLRYADDSRKTPIQAEVASFGVGLRAAIEAGSGEPKVVIDQLQSEIKQIALRERAREKPLAQLESLALSGGQVDLAKSAIVVQRIALNGGETAIERNEQGAIHLVEVLAPKDGGTQRPDRHSTESSPAEGGQPWHVEVQQVSLNGFKAAVVDHSVTPAMDLHLGGADFHFKNVSNDGKTPMAFDGKLLIAPGGELAVQGSALPTGERGQADVRLDRLDLTSLQPYVAQAGALKLESGNLSTRMKVGFQQKSGKLSATAKGEMASANLMLKETKTGKRFAAWDKVSVAGIDFSLAPNKLAIREIHAIKPGANLEIFEDRSTNIDVVFAPKKRVAPPQKRIPPPAKRVSGQTFPFSVQRVKVDSAVVDFSDASLVLPFKTRIQNFGGTISGISNAPSARALLKLDGRVDEYGEANLEGTLDLMQHNAYSDVTLIFRNVEMSSLSPYSGTFAGRRIQSGKLNAELQYKIENSKLNSHGKIELDQMALGAEVVSPKAKSLPLDLAVALLTDSSGKIKVSIPIEGNVDNPEFSYGSVIWNAIATLITKAVTAPFTALASVMGDGQQDMGEIFFIPGKSGLPPAEIEKLKKLATALTSRPKVVLVVKGTFDPKLDAEALKSWDVRNAVTERLGISVAPGEDPGPLAFDSAKTQKALEDLADERGKALLDSALAAFRAKNGREPKRIGALSSWMDKASEDAQFYQLLFGRLVDSAPLPPKALESLAERRSRVVVKELGIYKGLDRGRLRLGTVSAAGDNEGRIPTRLDLKAGG